MAIKPEKDTALVIAFMSLTICVSELNIIWKRISELRENRITYKILETKSLKFEL